MSDRLTALDAAYLVAEKPGVPMHIGSLVTFEAAPLLDGRGRFRTRAVRRHVEQRLVAVPRLRRRLSVPGWASPNRPAWVDDDDFDVARHVRVLRVPPPGDEAQVREVCARLHEAPLDRARPLWELWFLTGLGGALAGRVAMVEKIHHALADGVSGVDIVSVLFDGDGAEPLSAAAFPEPVARDAVGAIGDAISGVRALVARPELAPPCSLNRAVSGRRRLEVVRRRVEGVRAVRSSLGGTLNDVVLAAVAGGVRALLLARGEPPPVPLRVLVPVSVRAAHQRLGPANRTGALLVHLPVHLSDPLARLACVQTEVTDLKRSHEAEVTLGLLELTDLVPAPLLGPLSRLVVHHQPLVNLVVTNVPGARSPLSMLGARMLDAVPIVPLGGNLTVGVAALSYCEELAVGLHVDPVAVPDVAVLRDGVDAAFDELEALAGLHGRDGAKLRR